MAQHPTRLAAFRRGMAGKPASGCCAEPAVDCESIVFGATTLGTSAVLARLALGVAASVPLAVLIELLPWRRSAKHGKNQAPRYLWRGLVGTYSLIGGGALSTIALSEPLRVRQHHSYFFFVEIALEAIAVALFIWNLQYSRRLRRRTAEAASSGLGQM